MAGIFNYRFKENYGSGTCVVKFTFGQEGKKFFIWKCLKLHASCEQVFRDLNRKIANGCKDTDLFFRVVEYCRKSRINLATVEMLYQSDNLPDIMAFDQQVLAASAGDPNCLNLNFDQYIPKWLDGVTANKALQSTFSVKPNTHIAKKVKLAPVAKEIPTEAKQQPGSNSKMSIADKIRALKEAKA
jgi:hypothetical protein